jgi:hypothetical protein
MAETLLSPSNILIFGRVVEDLVVGPSATGGPRHSPFVVDRAGGDRDLENRLTTDNPTIARIYSFSYEGTYYDLPKPALFLVHGPGKLVTKAPAPRRRDDNGNEVVLPVPPPEPARAPGEPSLTGVAAADFQFVDGIMAWSYDKADHTIRMDVEAGEFEDVLLNMFFDGGGPAVSGARVSGARVSGARVSGARVSGARLSGGRGDSSD